MIKTVVTTKDGVVIASRERSNEIVFVGHADDTIGAINAAPQLGSEHPDCGFIVSSVTAKRISDWGSWLDWLLCRSKQKWLIEVAYMQQVLADEKTESKCD